MSTTTLATRLPEPLLREVRRFAKRGRLGPSEALRAVVTEWVATAKYPAVEFRDGPMGRRPALRDGPEVWEVARAARDGGEEVEALRRRFGARLSADAIGAALEYAAEHREEVEACIEEQERLERAAQRPSGAVDRPFDPEAVMHEAVARMAVERKLEVARGLRELAWETRAAALRAVSPGLPEAEVRERVRQAFLDAIR